MVLLCRPVQLRSPAASAGRASFMNPIPVKCPIICRAVECPIICRAKLFAYICRMQNSASKREQELYSASAGWLAGPFPKPHSSLLPTPYLCTCFTDGIKGILMVFSHVAWLGGFGVLSELWSKFRLLINLRVECFDYMQKYPRFAELSVCNCMTAAGAQGDWKSACHWGPDKPSQQWGPAFCQASRIYEGLCMPLQTGPWRDTWCLLYINNVHSASRDLSTA